MDTGIDVYINDISYQKLYIPNRLIKIDNLGAFVI